MDVFLPCVSDGCEGHIVVLSWRQFSQRVRSQFPIGQETTPGVQASGHVDHKAIWDASRVAAPGDQRRVSGHM